MPLGRLLLLADIHIDVSIFRPMVFVELEQDGCCILVIKNFGIFCCIAKSVPRLSLHIGGIIQMKKKKTESQPLRCTYSGTFIIPFLPAMLLWLQEKGDYTTICKIFVFKMCKIFV